MAATLDWINLLVRVVHLVVGIGWIGSSFYFIWLDRHLTNPSTPRPGVQGELWMVHSGGFYQVERRRLAAGALPPVLHWFKWEAALTWASGIVLLIVVYYLTGGVYLLDPRVSSFTSTHAMGVAVALLVFGWIAYDQIWRSRWSRAAGGLPATVVSLVALAAAVLLFFRVLSGRAAFIHVGSLLGTLMVANVWWVILPAQGRMIEATARGVEADRSLGEQAKRRSVHNSYLTFPVLFIMLSTHFPQTYGHSLGWLVLVLLTVAGAAARHAMIGAGARARWALVPMGLCLAAAVILSTPRGPASGVNRGEGRRAADARRRGEEVPSFAAARAVINARCLPCHSAYPADSVFTVAPNGVTFDTPEDVVRWAARILERAVVQRTMPLVNKTGMEEPERELLGRWLNAGAVLR